jgi:hypothetical protein
VGVARRYPRSRKFEEIAPIVEDIQSLSRKVPSLDKHVAGAHAADLPGGLSHPFRTPDFPSGQASASGMLG